MKPLNPIKTDASGRAAYRLREASELTGIPLIQAENPSSYFMRRVKNDQESRVA